MSKSRKRSQRDFDDGDYYDRRPVWAEKRRNKRVERALRTKDVGMLLEQYDDDDELENQ